MIKIVLAVFAALLMASPAFAGSRSHANANSNSGASSNSGVSINNRGYKGVGAAIPPGLVASGLSCSGSTSIGGGWLGGGISLGFTKKDRDCDTRENAKMIGLMHEMNVAYEIMCGIDEVRQADARIGRDRCVANRRGVRHNARVSDFERFKRNSK
jgi:hypothetical protein